MSRLLAITTALLVLGTDAWADEPSAEARRAEAHRTVYRRFSRTQGAKTKSLGLSKEATAFVDLHLDMQRNRRETRSRRAPRSTMFMGSAHPVMQVEQGRLVYRAAFTNFTIDEVSLPLEELLEVLEVALDAKRFAPAGLPGEAADTRADDRLALIANVVTHGQPHLAKDERWAKALKAAGAALVEAVSTSDAMRIYPLLSGLKRIGDEETAEKLIGILESLPAADRRKGMLRACIAAMPAKAAQVFVLETLRGEDQAAIVAVLGGVGTHSDAATVALVAKILAPASAAHPGMRHNAIGALERTGSPAALQALRTTFEKSSSENEKYHVGCALVRIGSDVPVLWLRELLGKLRQRDDPRSKAKAAALERLLEKGS